MVMMSHFHQKCLSLLAIGYVSCALSRQFFIPTRMSVDLPEAYQYIFYVMPRIVRQSVSSFVTY
jgi:hypothetical protein